MDENFCCDADVSALDTASVDPSTFGVEFVYVDGDDVPDVAYVYSGMDQADPLLEVSNAVVSYNIDDDPEVDVAYTMLSDGTLIEVDLDGPVELGEAPPLPVGVDGDSNDQSVIPAGQLGGPSN